MEWALKNWNGKLAELWELITQSPATFKGGEIWTVITAISNALVGIGYGLLVLFFAMGVFQSAASFREIQRPEFAVSCPAWAERYPPPPPCQRKS